MKRHACHIIVCLAMTVLVNGCDRLATGADPTSDTKAGLAAYQAGDLAGAKTAWQHAASKGNADAEYYLGVLANEGADSDPIAAMDWFSKAAAQGHAKSQYNLALAYERGSGVTRNRATALRWLTKAANLGDIDAQHMLGLLLLDQRDPTDRELSDAGLKWIMKAANAGNARSQLVLGNSYLAGDIVDKQPILAERWLSAAVRSGLVEALRPLLLARRQIANDHAHISTDELLRKSRAGDATAQHQLAARLLQQDGVDADLKTAEYWLRKSANSGFAAAEYDLGVLLSQRAALSGESRNWIRRAADKRMARAQYALGRIYALGLGVEKDEKQAAHWYALAAEQGDPSAEYAMGYVLSEGAGRKQDDAQALEWFKRAAEDGHGESAFRISNMYANGEGVSKDTGEVRRWECRAFVLGSEEAGRNLEKYGGIDMACGDYRDDLAAFAIKVLGPPKQGAVALSGD